MSEHKNLIRIAHLWNKFTEPECVRRVAAIPSLKCQRLGPTLELAVFFLRLILKDNKLTQRFRLVFADEYSGNFTAEDDSVIGDVINGVADATAPFYFYTPQRFEQANMLRQVVPSKSTFTWIRSPLVYPALDLATSFPLPMIFVWASLASFRLVLHLSARLQRKTHCNAYRVFFAGFYSRILWRLITSYIVKTFNTIPAPFQQFYDAKGK